MSGAEEEVLGFVLGNELYGVDIQQIEEIRVWETPTPIPRAPDFIKGVINLRGMIVPIMDLRIRFSIGIVDYLKTTVVLVLRAQTDHGEKMMGIVVDAVSDVVDISKQEIGSTVGGTPVTPYMTGIVNVDQRVLTLLSVEQLLSIDRFMG
ncbi:chemotaxis protein CheW [Photobacterium sp. TY1-4]|nr:chemotaxis protein CheW [Photobacterium sp. TY1-4]